MFAFYFFKMLKNHIALLKKARNQGARCHLMGQTLHKMNNTINSRKTSVYAEIDGWNVLLKNEKSRHRYGDTHVGMNVVEAIR